MPWEGVKGLCTLVWGYSGSHGQASVAWERKDGFLSICRRTSLLGRTLGNHHQERKQTRNLPYIKSRGLNEFVKMAHKATPPPGGRGAALQKMWPQVRQNLACGIIIRLHLVPRTLGNISLQQLFPGDRLGENLPFQPEIIVHLEVLREVYPLAQDTL